MDVDAACPQCGGRELHLAMRLVSRPLGSFSVAGGQMKTSAYEWPYLTCRTCGFTEPGKVEGR